MTTGDARAETLPNRATLVDIAESVGTPVYVYDAAVIRAAYRAFADSLAGHPHAIHYALKANSTLALVRLLRSLGAEADANSGGEIEVALRAGYIPEQIVFTGVGKTGDELDRAVSLGVKAINAESPGELDRIAARARALDTTVRVAMRVNPDIDAKSHPHISTGLKTNKFGMPLDQVRALYREHARQPGLAPVGLHIHVGSQITSLEPLRRAAERAVALARELRGDGIDIEHLDLGGGLGISYDGSPVPTPGEYAAAILPILKDTGFSLVIEPGRALVGAAGTLLARVIDLKQYDDGLRFAVLDAGMTELMRPALYGAYHRIVPVTRREGDVHSYEIVGPLCESSDIFGRNRQLPALEVDDVMAILDAGAYGSAMASTYNRRPLLAEVLIDDQSDPHRGNHDDTTTRWHDGQGRTRWRVIRRRQTIDELLSTEL
jgi:diaminopimelate decarboxylase